jgi:hypothetical protein
VSHLQRHRLQRFNFSLLYARAVGWGDSDPDTHERLISFVGGGSGYHCVWLVGALGVRDRPAVGACDSLILLTRQAEGREREGLTTHTLQDHGNRGPNIPWANPRFESFKTAGSCGWGTPAIGVRWPAWRPRLVRRAHRLVERLERLPVQAQILPKEWS